MPGEITELARFIVPVRKAKIVPSILGGVIFANNASIGKVYKITPTTEKTVSVKIKKTMSGTPASKFQRIAKLNWRNVATTPTHMAKNIIHLVSIFLHHAL